MGGLGSGARNRFAPKTDEFRSIDLADLNRWGVFKPGGHRSGELRWSRGGQRTGEIGYRVTDDAFVLDYRSKPHGETEWRSVVDPIAWSWSDQPLGGRRRWFACPGCARKVRVLFGGSRFRCRSCYGAVYESQYDKFRVPGLAATQRARHRLGGEPGLSHPFPPRPKGMHRRTYDRLEQRDWEVMLAFDRVTDRLLRM